MGIFDLFRTWVGFGKPAARARRRPEISKTEALEVRRMLTVNVSLAATTLTVAGTGGDTIEIIQNASGTDVIWNGGGANSQHFGPGTTIDTIDVTEGTGAGTITITELLPTTTATVDGGTSMSTLISPTLANTWDITGTDSGTLNVNTSFTNIDSLQGGSTDDTFLFGAAGSLDGSIDGGAGGTNTLDYTNAASAATVDFSAYSASNVTGGFIDGSINNIVGNGTGDTIIGGMVVNTWDISGVNSGDVNDDLGNTVTFSNISNLTGNSDDDTFLFLGGSIDGLVDGGAGGINSLDYSNTNTPITFDLSSYTTTDTGGFVDGTINNLVGSSDATGDTIIGATASNTFQITGLNSGNVNDDLFNTITFSAIKSLTGGMLDNTFVFQDGASLDGILDGGLGGATTLDYSSTTTGIFVDLQTDTATALGLGFVDGTINNIIGSTDVTDTISSSNNTTAWTIDGVDSGSTQDSFGSTVTFSNIKNLTGGTGDDTFSFMDGGLVEGAVDGGGGNNTLDYSSLTSPMSADLQNFFATGIGTTFANISLIVGTGQSGDQLIGSDSVNTWTIDGPDSGAVDNGGGPIGYLNIVNLTGGASDDTYFFQDGGSVSGSISDLSGFNTLDFSSLTNLLTVDLNTSSASIDVGPTTILASFTGISNLVGNSVGATLIAPDTSNIWNINGTDAGDINGLSFSGFDLLTGGALDDTFLFATTGSVSGSISGGADTNNTIVGADQVNTWTLTGADAGDLNGSLFTNIQNLTGGAFSDNFVFMPTGNVQGNIDGSGDVNTLDYSNLNSGVVVNLQNSTAANVGGNITNITGMIGSFDVTDVLIGPDTSNVWTIDGFDSGNLNNFQFSFSGVENLTGGALDDTFAFTDTGFIENTIDGGAGANALDYSAMTSPVTANLNASGSTGIGVAFTNIQNLIGTGLGDTIIANDYDNVWTIDGVDSGNVVSQFSAMNFQNFANLTGGALDDTYLITDAGLVSGLIDGTTGNNTLNFSQRSDDITVDLNVQSIAGIVGSFNNITNYVGNAGTNSTMAGPNSNNLWNITSGNSGDVNGTTFSGFKNLTGGSDDDTFAFGATGFVSGAVAGGTGTDTLDYSARTAGIVADLQLRTATAIGGGWSSIQNIVGANKGDDKLIGNNANSVWQINDAGGNAGSTTWNSITVTFSGIGNLQGGIGNDRFAFSNLGFVTGNIFGGAGNNTLDWSADPTAITVNTQANTATGIGGKFASIQNFIFPNGQNNTLVGSNQNNVWNITGANSGNLNGVSFNNVANLVGGSLLDTFKFAAGGFVSGSINGSAGTNTLDYSALSIGALINLQSGSASNVGGGFSSIQNLIGSSGSDDKIVGANTTNTWHITAANAGDANSTITFSKFENLTGGSLNDTFTFVPGGFVSGAIAGGAGANNTLNYSGLNSGITANLQTNSSTNIGGGFSSIQTIVGANHGDDVLIGANYANIWDLNNFNQLPGVTGNAGSVQSLVNNQSIITYFRGINNLVGGSSSDWFKIETGAFISGSIKGMAGNNALDYSSYGASATVNMQTNSATAIGGGFASLLGVVGSTTVADTLIGFNVGNTFTVTGTNTGYVNNNFGFTNFRNLTGGTGIDVFSLNAGGSMTGTVNGGTATGGDWLNYLGIATSVTANLATNTATGFATLANIQNVLGGSGSNTLTGNAQGNILVGGSGVDTITGGSGRSLLIGGLSGDTVKGGAGQDIVIGGYTNYDSSLVALNSILAEWQLNTPFQTRVDHLRTGGGLNGNVVLVANATVHNDSAVNAIYGGAGPNWLFGQPAEFKDKTANDVTDTPIDNNITVSGASNVVYTLNQPAVLVDPTITLSSAANNNNVITLSYATIKLTANYMSNQDTLTFSPTSATGNIVGAFNSSTGTMTLSSLGNKATMAQFQAAIQQVRYQNTANLGANPFAPSTLTRYVETQIFDGQRLSNTAIGTIGFNTAPTIANNSNLTYTTLQGPVVLSPNITVADADSQRLASATVAITTNYNSNQDRLIFTQSALTGDITASFNTTTGVLTLTSANSIQATVAQYQAALRQVQYQNTAAFPFKQNRVVTYQVSDGAGVSNKLTSTITFN